MKQKVDFREKALIPAEIFIRLINVDKYGLCRMMGAIALKKKKYTFDLYYDGSVRHLKIDRTKVSFQDPMFMIFNSYFFEALDGAYDKATGGQY